MTKSKESIANRVRVLREQQLMSKAELARKAGLSPLTIDRVEHGMGCRMDTKRKIILALGLKVADKDQVFVPSAEDEDELVLGAGIAASAVGAEGSRPGPGGMEAVRIGVTQDEVGVAASHRGPGARKPRGH